MTFTVTKSAKYTLYFLNDNQIKTSSQPWDHISSPITDNQQPGDFETACLIL